MSKIRYIFNTLLKAIKFSLFAIKFLCKIISKIFESILEKLRFSITFKITVAYVLTFLTVFFLMSGTILISFKYYIDNGINGDYLSILGTILIVCNITGLVIIAVIGARASKKFLSPVDTMTKTVKEISINALDKRLDVKGSKNELKDLAKTFNEMLDRIEISVEQQNQFVSDASHELRTPISVIQGYANLLDRWGKDDKEVLQESISSIKSEAENMKELVEKLLFLARSDKHTQKIEKQPFMMDELIEEILRETKLIDISHHIESDYNEKFTLFADRKLVKEALRIFIDNSIKYTPEEGTIKVDSYVKSTTAVVTIGDTGIGISENDLPNIFNRFYRADKSRTKSSGGTGLGLSIAKWIIENHNGKIDVWSKIDIGTVIRIELPLR
ncbi:HAMP domain-containing sensor histidine kinase [Clostridium sp. A1-XYC3]|uniref:histidine kinase n=1 Tax=Clostridium tanneri TaxID=3037988 RepID=A0ABU4JQW8_9CLOT|nr:HAMP domain-containing sensor histidine kinase [Clostridium sp. A1-XYC3]MDW8800491.1 HAMP domain-containing sensor histidine kinase [Clostridium sp. A1-XYC3]